MLPDDADRAYRALHKGRAPEPASVRVHAPRWLVEVGRLHAVEYHKEVPGGVEYRRHEFRADAAPRLAHDERGQLHAVGGRYSTTARGIVDAEGDSMREVPLANPDMGDAMEVATTVGTAGASGVVVHLVGTQMPGGEYARFGAQAALTALAALGLYAAGAPRRVVDGVLGGGASATAIRGADALAVNGYVARWVARMKNPTQPATAPATPGALPANPATPTGGSQGMYDYAHR